MLLVYRVIKEYQWLSCARKIDKQYMLSVIPIIASLQLWHMQFLLSD